MWASKKFSDFWYNHRESSTTLQEFLWVNKHSQQSINDGRTIVRTVMTGKMGIYFSCKNIFTEKKEILDGFDLR